MGKVTREVMEENGIPRRGSPELVKLWEQKLQAKQGKATISATDLEAENP